MSDGIIPGFERRLLPGDGVEIDALVGGSGPPLLLLHGWPQTRMCWGNVAPLLLDRFTVVVPDLRGYGRSGKPDGDPEHKTHSKRQMARDQLATMAALGFERFAVAGHDRGGRVAYRLALDHPVAVTRIAVLDIVPTAEVWARMTPEAAVGMWHWTFQVQPRGLPERMIGAEPELFVRHVLGALSAHPSFDPAHLDDYLACVRDPGMIHGMCEDYRAGWTIDRSLDEADQKAGRKIEAPLLALWGEKGAAARSDPLATWHRWAHDVSGAALPCGHFLPEEAPRETAEALIAFFSAG